LLEFLPSHTGNAGYDVIPLMSVDGATELSNP